MDISLRLMCVDRIKLHHPLPALLLQMIMQRLWLPWMRMYLIRPMEVVPWKQVILRYPLPEELQPYPVLHQPVFLAADKPIHWESVYQEYLVEQKSLP